MGHRNGKRGTQRQQPGAVPLHVKLQSRIGTLQVENKRLQDRLAALEAHEQAALDGLQQRYEGKLARLHEDHTREQGVLRAQHAVELEAQANGALHKIHLEVRRVVESRGKAAAKFEEELARLAEQLEDTQRLRGEAMDELDKARANHTAELASLRTQHADELAKLREANEELRRLVVDGLQLIESMREAGVAPGWLIQMYTELAMAKQNKASEAHVRERSGQLVAKVLRWCYDQLVQDGVIQHVNAAQEVVAQGAPSEGEAVPASEPPAPVEEMAPLAASVDQPKVEEGQPCGS